MPGNEVFNESDSHTPLGFQSSFKLEDSLKFGGLAPIHDSEMNLDKENSFDQMDPISDKNNLPEGILQTEEQQKHMIEQQEFHDEENLSMGNEEKLISSPSPPEQREEEKEQSEHIQSLKEELIEEKRSPEPSLEDPKSQMEVDKAEER